MDPFMERGIRWLRFNGGIRRWIMKGKGHKERKSTREGRVLFGGQDILIYERWRR
jgi:hypothetical protein